jgi:hypothetical protein
MLSQKFTFPCLALLLLGCTSTTASTTTPEAQTLIGVDPKDFMADDACGTRIERYVGTLADVTGPSGLVASGSEGVANAAFIVGSSPPTDCAESVVFAEVVAYHAYEVNLDGYDRADIEPAAAGSSAMLASGTYVAPRFSAVCRGWTNTDGGSEPGVASPNATIFLGNCTKLGN